jgi:hypothetical protein
MSTRPAGGTWIVFGSDRPRLNNKKCSYLSELKWYSHKFTTEALQHADRFLLLAGFSLHAGVAARANERDKLERLCRYIAGPAVSTKRLSLIRNGQVRYELKTPYNDGTR